MIEGILKSVLRTVSSEKLEVSLLGEIGENKRGSDNTPLFSIVMPDYDGAVPRELVRRSVDSVFSQSHDAWELLLYHDGPKATAYREDLDARLDDVRIKTHITEQRFNDWGHSLRDMGIRAASGKYIVHLNADNLLYPNALLRIHEVSLRSLPPIHAKVFFGGSDESALDQMPDVAHVNSSPDLIVYAILKRGMVSTAEHVFRCRGSEEYYSIILSGVPPRLNNIDCMQLVMKRELWLAEGGWYDKRMDGDGYMIEKFCRKYGFRVVPEVLGEHW